MKAKPYKLIEGGGSYTPCEIQEATHIELNMPGPIPFRLIPVITHGDRRGTPCWTWNGDTEKPTLKPSILSKGGPHGESVCHTFVNNGCVQFLEDCSHELAGQTVDLLDIED